MGVGGVAPAAGQRFAGGEAQLALGEVMGILQLLPGMDLPQHRRREGIGQLAEIEDLHQGGIVAGHGSRPQGAVLVEGEEHRRRLCGSCDSSPEDGERG